MEVSSWLTGKRGVSLPFTDQCLPIFRGRDTLDAAVQWAIDYGEKNGWKYIEWREGEYFPAETTPWKTYFTHTLDLNKPESTLFSTLSDNNRRNIKKAMREGVHIEIKQTFESLHSFYRLNCLTRRRHGLPPQPFIFFHNVLEDIILRGHGTIIQASYKGNVIAASVFFHFKTHALYKYGASDLRYQHLRPNNLIMWEAIKKYHHLGFRTMNLGRTEQENRGLLRYKRTWGGHESPLKYYRFGCRKKMFLQESSGVEDFSKKIMSRAPMGILRTVGRMFYKHVG
jgi:hypothetical protein